MKLDHTPLLVKVPGLVRGFRLVNVANKAPPLCRPMTRRGKILAANIIMIITDIITIIIVIIIYPYPSHFSLLRYCLVSVTAKHLHPFNLYKNLARCYTHFIDEETRPLLDKVTHTVSGGACVFKHYPIVPPYIWIYYDFTEFSRGGEGNPSR